MAQRRVPFDNEYCDMHVQKTKIIGEFNVIDDKLHIGTSGQPILDYTNIDLYKNPLNLTEGYTPGLDLTNDHGIKYIYDFLENSGLKEKLKNEEVPIACGRYVITAIDDALWDRSKTFELLAIRMDDIIYIGLNRTIEQGGSNDAENGINLYCGLQFGKKITRQDENFTLSFKDSHSVMRKIKLINKTYGKTVSVLVSTSVRAFDENLKPVELHTVTRQLGIGFYRHKARKWWIRAFLSGANRVVYGIKNDNQVQDIRTIETEKLIHKSWKYGPDKSIQFIYDVFAGVQSFLSQNDECCTVTMDPSETCLNIQKVSIEHTKKSSYW